MATSTKRPVLLGIAASALAAPTAFFAYATVPALAVSSLDVTGLALAALVIYFFGLMVSFPASLAVGLPCVIWLQRRGHLTWLNVCAVATALGVFIFLGLWYMSYQSYQPLIVFGCLGAASGFISGAAFCAVVRPNNSFKPNPLRGSA
jgi:hypothetical protein